MKSYTDLEQSKKLAEILPIESADMHYATWTILDGEFIVSPNQGSTIEDLQEDYGNQIIPCWSLAVLIDILPDTITDKIGTIFGLNIKKNFVEYYNPSMGALCATYHSIIAEDLVDACYEMIIYLNELKKL